MLRHVEIIFRIFYNAMYFQFGKLYLHSTSCQCGVGMYWIGLPVLWVSCYVSVLFSSSYVKNLVFGKGAAVFQVLLLCAEVVQVECLHGSQMLHFVCDVQYSYHVSTVQKTGASLHYRKS